MAEIITMPRLSDTMTEGKVSKWHKNIGDQINEGDILAEIETDKAVQDFESEFNGTLLYIGTQENDTANVDSILAIIGNKNEDINALIGGNPSEQIPTEKEEKINIVENKNIEVPTNVEIITMPRLSDTMTEGKVAKWHKNIGDQINEGDILAEIETDKAVQDFESEFNGTLLYIGTQENDTAQVDSILAIIGEKGTDISALINPNSNDSNTKQNIEIIEDKVQIDSNQTYENNPNNNERIFISPLAKKIAKEKGLNINQIKGSGENGRIVKHDVESFVPSENKIEKKQEVKSVPQIISAPIIQGIDSETTNSQMRKIIAKRLSESKFTAPHYYLMVEVNMESAMESRKIINNLPETKVSFNDMVIKAVAMSLKKHPQINSSWTEEKIIHHGNINVGVAVAIPDGLVVPVLNNTDFMSLTQISSNVKDLASRAKNKGLKANEMSGSTFSISNLGMFGIESFTSIINQPNSCILSVGAIIEKPIVKNGNIVVGNTMKLSLACDHRVVDGATGAQFLQTLKTYLENPVTMLA